MTALSSYSTGTVSVAEGGTTVTGTGTIWSGVNVRPGDILQIGNFQTIIADVTDTSTLTIPPWGGGDQADVAYAIWQWFPQRVAGAEVSATVNKLVAALEADGFIWFVDADLTEPDPSLGDEGQFAQQPSTGKTWVKDGGVWDYLGLYKPFRFTGAYNGSTTYSVGDVMTDAGSSYVWINETPGSGHAAPNTTYWQLLAAKGDPGAAATVTVGSVSTVAYGAPATVTNSGTSDAAVLDFEIPEGAPGTGDMTSTNYASEYAGHEAVVRSNLGIPGKNYLLNPSGEVDQEVVGGGVSRADAAYDFDQWLTLTQSNPVTVSSVADAENGTPFMMRSLQANASAQRFGRIQWLESRFCKELRGKTVALSARVRMSAATTLRYAIVEWTGTADTIAKDVVASWTNGTFTAGNFFTSTSTTVVAVGSTALVANTLTDITALTGTVSGSMNNLAVLLWTDSAQAQNVTLDIAKVKLEQSNTPSTFIAPDFAAELTRCQRYWEKTYDYNVTVGTGGHVAGFMQALLQLATGTVSSSSGNGQSAQYLVAKRSSPTVTAYSSGTGASGKVADLAAGSDVNATVVTAGTRGFRWFGTAVSAIGTLSLGAHFTFNARL